MSWGVLNLAGKHTAYGGIPEWLIQSSRPAGVTLGPLGAILAPNPQWDPLSADPPYLFI